MYAFHVGAPELPRFVTLRLLQKGVGKFFLIST